LNEFDNVLKIDNYEFEKICDIVPHLDQNGKPIEYFPQNDYENKNNLALHNYGNGPFCRFKIDSVNLGKTGVYVILVDKKIMYVGECEDLYSIYSVGYGNISPRNCFQGGQSTNCRINNLILKSYKAGSKIELYFIISENRFLVEHDMISRHVPAWNKTMGKISFSMGSGLLSKEPTTKLMSVSEDLQHRDVLIGRYKTMTGKSFDVISVTGNMITVKISNSKTRCFHLEHLLLCKKWLYEGKIIRGTAGDSSILSLIGKTGVLVKCELCDRNPAYIFGIISAMSNVKRDGRTLRYEKN